MKTDPPRRGGGEKGRQGCIPMTSKERIIEASTTQNGGFRSMITKLEAATVREEYFTKKRSIRCIARWHGLSRNTVRRYLREEDRKPYPLSEAGAFLKEQEIGELYAKCELRCPPLQRLIRNQYDQEISLRMLERFCQPMLEEARRQVYLEEPVGRFETGPRQHLHFFVCKLGYSRRIFAKAYYLETQEA